MRILIGYSMRSGSTLLQHILGQHSAVTSYSDLSSFPVLARLVAGLPVSGTICVKPMDLFFLFDRLLLQPYFDRFVWIARDPRDAYLSAMESRYAYLFWPPGRKEAGIDTGQLRRWQRVYRHYFSNPARWHLVKYETLVEEPDAELTRLLAYLELPFERLYPFMRFQMRNGGDPKLRATHSIHSASSGRYRRSLSDLQQAVFRKYLGPEMAALGYDHPVQRPIAAVGESGSVRPIR